MPHPLSCRHLMTRASRRALSRAALLVLCALCVPACTDEPARQPPLLIVDGEDMGTPPVDMSAPPVDMADMTAPPADMTPPPDMAPPVDMNPPPVDMNPPPGPGPKLAEGLAIQHVDLFQTIQRRIVEGGQGVASETPLIANRETLVRVHVDTLEGWTPRPVTLQVVVQQMDGAETTHESTITLSGPSDELDRNTIPEVRVPADALVPGARLSVRLLGDPDGSGASVDSPAAHPARWPATDALADMEVTTAPGEINVVLVPFKYDTDGSGRMPDTSPQQLALFKNRLQELYPAMDIKLSVRAHTVWTTSTDWGDFNVRLRSLRADDNPPYGTFYYGVISPDTDFNAYCNGTCTTGQSFTVSRAQNDSYRVGSGLGFSGERWAGTLTHELGHMNGRGHAKCGVSFFSQDRNYPYSGGYLGVWGWSARTGVIFPPRSATDFMGYCDDQWVSDYTYIGIYDRLVAVQNLARTQAIGGPIKRWRTIHWSASRGARLGEELRARSVATGESWPVRLIGPDGRVLRTLDAPVARLAHDNTRTLHLPQQPPEVRAVELTDPKGRTVRLAL